MPRRYQSRIGLLDSTPALTDQVDELEGDAMGYPRPQLRRQHWWSLNGPWQFELDSEVEYASAEQVPWSRTIIVPFSPETEQSGIADTGLYRACWYRRQFSAPKLEPAQ